MSDHLKREPFWLVWNPQGRAPTNKHHTKGAAENEAKRLSRVSPGSDFFVMEAVGGFIITEPPVQALDIDPEFIPF